MVSAQGLIPILTGVTASGKTQIALEFATDPGRQKRIEIINADSLLVYRGMDIGTAKPSLQERALVAHHLIDIRDPHEAYTAADFVRDAHAAIAEVRARGAQPLIVGGTGFYLKALIFGLWEAPPTDQAFRSQLRDVSTAELYARLEQVDAQAAIKITAGDRYRLIRALEVHALSGRLPSELERERRGPPDPRFRLLWLDRESSQLDERITERARSMLAAGLIDEVKKVVPTADDRLSPSSAVGTTWRAVGYAQVSDYLAGKKPPGRKILAGEEGLLAEIALATRQLVKAQRTWFKGQFQKRAPEICQTFILDRDRKSVFNELHALTQS